MTSLDVVYNIPYRRAPRLAFRPSACVARAKVSQCWQARPWTFIFYIIFILTHQKSFNWFNLSSKYSNSMENITGKRSDPVRKIINIAQKTRQHCYTKLGKVTQKCHIQVPKKPC